MTATSLAPARSAGPSDAAAAASDDSLIRSCLRGDQRAWDQLVDRYGRLVYSVARRHGLGAADADDIFQQVFAIAHRKLHDLREVSRLSAWLVTTTLRECRRVRRWLPRREALDGIPVAQVAPDEEASALERQHIVRQALARLGGRDARLLTALFFSPGRPDYQRIARNLGMRPGSIGPTRAPCFKKLEKILAEMGLHEVGAEPSRSSRGRRLAG